MIFRNIKRLEVMKVVLDFWAMSHIKPRAGKNFLNPPQRSTDGVQGTLVPPPARKRNVWFLIHSDAAGR